MILKRFGVRNDLKEVKEREPPIFWLNPSNK